MVTDDDKSGEAWPVGSKSRQTLAVLVSSGWNLLDEPKVVKKLRSVGPALGCGTYDPQSDIWTPQKVPKKKKPSKKKQ